MKNKKYLTYATMLLLLGVIIAPGINASIVQISVDKNENMVDLGRIHGSVYEASFFESPPVILAKLVLETEGIKKTTYTGLLGGFQFNDLPIGLTYTITASHPQYYTKVYTYTLSPDKPDLEVAMNLYKKDDHSKVRTTAEKPACLGSIYGNAGTSHGWGFSPVFFTKISAGGRTTISLPFNGQYRINNLFLGTYTITGRKIGYDTFTDTVTLTKDRPDKQVFIHMEPNDKSVNKAKTPDEKNIEETKCYGTIFGKTEGSFEHAAWTLPFVKIVTEGKTVYSGLGGRYIISGLELGYTYEIIASKPGYYNATYHVELTAEEPHKYQYISLMFNHDDQIVEKTIKQDKKSKTTQETMEKIENDDNTGKYGRVSGMVHTGGFPPYTEISGAKLVLEGDAINRITFSGILGIYRFNFLTIGRLYTITVSHPKYKTQTDTFTPTVDKPHIFLNFPMYVKTTRNINIEEPARLGSIHGNTGEWYIWGFSPVGLVKVEAGGKSTISSPIMGFYKIRNLPLGKYTVTGTKKGYDTFTDTVTLTEEHPDQIVFVHMEPNDVSVNKVRSSNIANILGKIMLLCYYINVI